MAVELDGNRVVLDREAAARTAVKYGAAVAHTVRLYRHLERAAPQPVEVEVSVEETEHPTTAAQHVYLAGELRRLGVRWVSLVPRFVGRMEKGVDYQGDPAAFEADCARHAAIVRSLGPYKLSLYSGSDKLTIYPGFARAVGELGHLKTAGTSYLEAWRLAARIDPALFLEAYRLARTCYERERVSYHVSAWLDRAPVPEAVTNDELPPCSTTSTFVRSCTSPSGRSWRSWAGRWSHSSAGRRTRTRRRSRPTSGATSRPSPRPIRRDGDGRASPPRRVRPGLRPHPMRRGRRARGRGTRG
jgi:hypothetical protein